MKRLTRSIAIFLLFISIAGCINLSRTEKNMLQELKSHGISETEVKVKHPATAGALNILPGFGNFYLAIGTEESSQWLYGFLNLLTWPFSIIWGIPEAAIDAENINKRETVYYYTYDQSGKKELQSLK